MRILFLSLLCLSVSACFATTATPDLSQSVTVKYDKYDYDIADLTKSADASCAARYPNTIAIPDGDVENSGSVKWSYMSFLCLVPKKR